jgi:hypothetical protein
LPLPEEKKMSSEIDLRSQNVHLGADGIVRARLKPHLQIELADAEAAVHSIGQLAAGKRVPVLVDMSQLKAMNRDARVYFAGPQTAQVESAVALLITSPLGRAIGNFFLGINKPLFPTRLFTSETEAISWLSGFLSP